MRKTTASPALWLGVACFAIHLFANPHYGVFRDELYFIVCGEHFAFGYVDQPPLIPWIAAASHALFGLALTPLRLVPALALSATVALTAQYARLLGGGRFAERLAGLCVLLAPLMLVDGVLLSTDSLQPLTWLVCIWALTRVAQGGDERWWVAFGAAVGLALAGKYMIAFFVIALGLGVIATPLRRSLARPWLYVGAALALLMAAPHLIWQAAHGWPFLEIARAGAGGKYVAFTPLGYIGQQVVLLGPVSAPVWAIGLWRLAKDVKLRAIAIAYGLMAAFFIVSHGKPYFLAPIYPALFAAGALAIEGWVGSRIARWGIAGVVAVAGLMTAPLALPILAPDVFIRYARALKMAPAAMENRKPSVLPEHFADMFGWREMAAEVARVYRSLPESERAEAVFFGWNYGEAAAVDIYGPELGAPPAISGHNNYFLWGPRGFTGSVVIMAGGDRSRLEAAFADVEVAGRISSPYAMGYENDLPVYVLRRSVKSFEEIWPTLKHYD